MRVLIIDDDPILIMVCTRLMKITGFSLEVSAAKEGREGMEQIKDQLANDPDALPEIILLDINMPVMNGWEFLDEFVTMLADFPRYIPVFMLSSTIDQADFDKAKTYEVVKGFYSKPLTKENLSEIEDMLPDFRG
ncbi:MAG: two-component system response regulator [Bacteroidia bacterium]